MRIPASRRILHHELVDIGPGSCFAVRRFRFPTLPFTWHQHPQLELTVILRGRGQRYVAGSVERFAPGDGVLIGADVPHTWASDPAGGPLESLCVQFPADLLGPGWLETGETHRLAGLFAEAGHGLVLDRATTDAVSAGLERALTLAPGPRRIAQLIELLGLIADAPRRRLSSLATTATPLIEARWGRILARIHAGATTSAVSQAVLASHAGLSPSSFARGFRRRFGRTFTDYLARVRLSHAARRLIESDDPIAVIAQQAGFANLSGFNRRFRTSNGCTPSRFRERHRPDGATRQRPG